ncbi:MAG TPA: DegT/DnrJ/EryC1/StrS family aminotransferase [Gemmatimonadaceae bacterium]|nr:DegT/DnrJ/EryC1/StrS family aminotransferase [Gemmatimonadaceae bacterium]
MTLAIKGGSPIRTSPFPVYSTLGEEEKQAVMRVLDSGNLSGFLGTWSPQFYGGPHVRKLEEEWQKYFNVAHAVTMNSATSALCAAVGAAGVGPGDEVIVSPITMTASATAALAYGAIPVFADIDPETFNITAKTIEACITRETRAIVAVDILGHPAEMDGIMALAEKHGLVVIEDAAQAPGATRNGRFAGTLAHIGVFSLNYHKTIHTGEGGVAVTDDAVLAERLQLIRNHAEAVVEGKGTVSLVNMVGFNYRMTEIEAAIGSTQLLKLDSLLSARIECADYLSQRIAAIPGLTPPVVQPGVKHGYYLYAIRYDAKVVGISREQFAEAIRAEGIPLATRYAPPLYFMPVYQQRVAFGSGGFPFTYEGYKGKVSYERGICPVAERMWESDVMVGNFCHAQIARGDLDDVVAALEKVVSGAGSLAGQGAETLDASRMAEDNAA